MVVHSVEETPQASEPAADEVHNSVLIRTHEPARMVHKWVVPVVLGIAVLTTAIIWGVMAANPAGPVVNHAVSSAPTSFATAPG